METGVFCFETDRDVLMVTGIEIDRYRYNRTLSPEQQQEMGAQASRWSLAGLSASQPHGRGGSETG